MTRKARLETLRRRHAVLERKYRQLARRFSETLRRRSDAVRLGELGIEASGGGLALIGGGRVVLASASLLRFERAGRWIAAEDPTAAPLPLRRLLLARAAEVVSLGVPGARERFRLDGGDRTIELRIEPVRDPRRRHQALAIVFDVTALQAIELELDRSRSTLERRDRLELVGQVASGIAHDIGNTLFSIRMRLDALGRAGPSPHVAALSELVQDLAERTRRLQELGERRKGRAPGRSDLRRVVLSAVELAASELDRGDRRRVTTLDVPAGLVVPGAEGELRHVVLNLLLNASQAMPEGGRLDVRARRRGGRIVLVVEDHGTGIPPDLLPHVFEPLVTGRPGRGSGLGLAIAALTLESLGGSIEAENRRGGGARFTITLPAAAGSPGPEAAAGVLGPVRRILLAEDDPGVREALCAALERHVLHPCRDGKEAIRLLERGVPIDVVLTDLAMPGATGWDVAAAARERRPRVPVYLLTGWADRIPRSGARSRLVEGVLPRTISLAELEATLAGIDRARGRSGARRRQAGRSDR